MTRVITWTLVGFGVLFIALLVFLGVAIGVEGAAGWVARFRDAMIVTVGVFQIITSVLTIALLMALLFAIVQINNQIQRTVIPKVEQVTAKVDGILENTRFNLGAGQRNITHRQRNHCLHRRTSCFAIHSGN
ncbi:MAG: hypothetical protein HC876_03575 [Chloroflexaceae bacterium]|nr:hypothetical protein [Chloroflexaceae bacterium]